MGKKAARVVLCGYVAYPMHSKQLHIQTVCLQCERAL
jgi:hypothetical protein